ncbi:MAG TPA: hypothetical protein VFZ68_01220 [Acidimicrobiales bacterium]
MRNRLRVALSATAVCALTIGTAAPVGAQEEPATLGFAVDKTQAQPDTLVLGKADSADVAEHCVTDVEEFQTRMQAFGEVLFELLPGLDPSAESNQDAVLFFYIAIALGVLFEPETAQDVLDQTFVMTFAEIATQEPVGEMGNFDPDTGEGSVVVPDIEPGMWAVAAACVGPVADADTILAGAAEHADFIRDELGLPPDPWPEDFNFSEFLVDKFTDAFTPEFRAFVERIGPTILASVVEPDAFGAVLFCILDPQGNCPDGTPPPPPGEPIDGGPPSEEPAPAQPIVAVPAFTG